MLSMFERGRGREVNENLMGCVWLIPELIVLNSERKGGFGLRVEEGPLTGPIDLWQPANSH